MHLRNIVTALLRAILLIISIPCLVWAATPVMQQIQSTADPALSSFIHQVVDNHPRIKAARANINASQALEAAATLPMYNPVLEIDGENTEVNTFTLGISQTLDWSNKRSARSTLAATERRARETEYKQARRKLSIDVLSALAIYQTNSERKALSLKQTVLMDKFSKLSRQGFEAGDISQVELNMAILLYADTQMQHSTAAASLVEAQQELRSITIEIHSENQWPILDTQLPALTVLTEVQTLLRALL